MTYGVSDLTVGVCTLALIVFGGVPFSDLWGWGDMSWLDGVEFDLG